MSVTVVQIIQAILAPAIMISSCGLIMLGLQNRYAFIVNRIRLLNEERRRLVKQFTTQKELDYAENVRFHSIRKQMEELARRAFILRNAILFEIVAVLFFVLTSFFIALYFFVESLFIEILPLISFLSGMASVFIGLILLGREIATAYRVITLEIKAEE
jgi:hypothetical protein